MADPWRTGGRTDVGRPKGCVVVDKNKEVPDAGAERWENPNTAAARVVTVSAAPNALQRKPHVVLGATKGALASPNSKGPLVA